MTNGDSYTEVTSTSWASRMMASIKGILLGFILFIVAFPVLFLNEGCSVRTAKGFKEGAQAAISIDAGRVDPGNSGKLVHMTGHAVTDEILTDPVFQVSATGIRLNRNTEMYQWKENVHTRTEKKLGGGEETVTTYSYEKTWSSGRIDSSRFRKTGYDNPPMPFNPDTWQARRVKLGDFRLSPSLIFQITQSEKIFLGQEAIDNLPSSLQAGASLHEGGFYTGNNPADPQIGDMRISFHVVRPQEVSVLSRQQDDTFEAYITTQGTSIDRLMSGSRSIDSMIARMHHENILRTWLIRLAGFMMMFIGMSLVFGPISTFGDVVPIVGSILRMGTGIIAFVIAFVFATTTIAIAWITYRPLFGISLLILAGGVFAGTWFISKQRKEKNVSAA